MKGDIRERRRGEPRRDGADDRDAVRGEIERARQRGRANDRNQDARHPWPPVPEHEDQGQRPDAERGGRGNGLAVDHAAHECFALVEEAGRVTVETDELRELTDEHDQRDAVEEADADRLREQLRQDAEAGEARRDAQRSHQQRQHSREGHRFRRVPVGAHERQDCRRDQRPERGVGAEHEDAGRSERRVRDECDNGRVQAGRRRKTRELGVGHPLRDEQCGEHQPRDEIGPEPRSPSNSAPGPVDCAAEPHATSSLAGPRGARQGRRSQTFAGRRDGNLP